VSRQHQEDEAMADLPRGIKVDCTKARAEYLLNCLNTGQPIEPSGKGAGWTGDDMLMLAGFCLFGASSQGPAAWGGEELVDPETYVQDLRGALETYVQLAMAATDGEFEAQYGHRIVGVAKLEGEAPKIAMHALPKTTWQ
jgi:hypothetical protein